jgi:L-asparaginase II
LQLIGQNSPMQNNSVVPLIEATRGGFSECVHYGAIAVVNAKGQVIASAGDPQFISFTRSCLKPFQALPFLMQGGAEHFEFSSEQIAMLCASHNGEAMHVSQAQRMLISAGKTKSALRCGCHLPLLYSFTSALPQADLAYDELAHNCSGKHSGFVAYCVQHGLPLDDYNDAAHPLQIAIRQAVIDACRAPESQMYMGIDGCSAPNYAMPLAHLAQGYARIACERDGSPISKAFEQIFNAMTAHPDLVSGTDRNDAAFMRAGRGDWVSKIGADGVQSVASRSRQQGFALKITDGNRIAATAATIEVMAQLGWMDESQAAELEVWRSAKIDTITGKTVGQRRAAFTLS